MVFSKLNGKEAKSYLTKKKNFSNNLVEFFRKENTNDTFFFTEQLVLTNKYINLISKKTEFNIYRKHFLDTLTIVIFFKCFEKKKKKNACVDIGTGSGFPGLLLSILLPESFFLLVESIQKKSYFHGKIINFLFLNNSITLNSRIEGMGKLKEHRGNYDFLTARAVSEINPLIQFSCPLVKKNGKILLFKQTKMINEELNYSKNSLKTSKKKIKGIYFVSSLNNGRIILLFQNKKENQ